MKMLLSKFNKKVIKYHNGLWLKEKLKIDYKNYEDKKEMINCKNHKIFKVGYSLRVVKMDSMKNRCPITTAYVAGPSATRSCQKELFHSYFFKEPPISLGESRRLNKERCWQCSKVLYLSAGYKSQEEYLPSSHKAG